MDVTRNFLTASTVLRLCVGVIDKLIMCPGVVRGRLGSRLPFVTARGVLVRTIGGNNGHRALRRRVHHRSVTTNTIMGIRNGPGSLIREVTTSPVFSLALSRVGTRLGPRGFVNETPRRMARFVRNSMGPILRGCGSLLKLRIRVGI